jgi:hypothetical protein
MKRCSLTLLLVGSLPATTASMARAQARTVTESVRLPLTATLVNPCTGEVVPLSGALHELFHVTTDDRFGFHVQVHSNPQGVTGVGASGTTYQATGVLQDSFNLTSGEAIANTPLIHNFLIIGQGDAKNNFVLHVTLHTTFANGALRAEVVNVSAECRG